LIVFFLQLTTGWRVVRAAFVAGRRSLGVGQKCLGSGRVVFSRATREARRGRMPKRKGEEEEEEKKRKGKKGRRPGLARNFYDTPNRPLNFFSPTAPRLERFRAADAPPALLLQRMEWALKTGPWQCRSRTHQPGHCRVPTVGGLRLAPLVDGFTSSLAVASWISRVCQRGAA